MRPLAVRVVDWVFRQAILRLAEKIFSQSETNRFRFEDKAGTHILCTGFKLHAPVQPIGKNLILAFPPSGDGKTPANAF